MKSGGVSYGGQSMYGPLERVLVRPPNEVFSQADLELWHYTAKPDLGRARAEHAALVELLESSGARVERHQAPLPDKADSIYVFDPALITGDGVVVLRPGKELRRGEEQALAARLEQLGVPLLFALQGQARAEGGDMLWLDHRTLVVGRGFRTNDEGLRQLSAGLQPLGVEVVAFDLPYFEGAQACLHLLSLVSLLDRDLAVVYSRLLPVAFRQLLCERGFELVEVAEHEFVTQAPNVLATTPRRAIMLAGNPVTQDRLERAGCRIDTYVGKEISLKAEGGPTCLTLPILRS